MKKFQKGFTLVELLIYMGIFSILLYCLLVLFTGILSTHADSQATSSLAQDGNYILARLSYDIRNADSTTISVPSATQINMTINGTATTISLSGTMLSEVASGTTYNLNSSNSKVTSVTFTKIGNTTAGSKPTIQVIIALTSTVVRPGPGAKSETFETTIGSR